MNKPRKLRVFICHAWQDKPAVRNLYDHLKSMDWIDPWIDEKRLLPGQDWDLEIYKAIREADSILVCLSNESIAKEGYIQKEFRRAINFSEEKPEGEIYIIPLLIDDCTPPLRFQKWQWANYSSEEGMRKLIEALLARADSLKIRANDESIIKKFARMKSPAHRPPGTDSKTYSFRFLIEMGLGLMLPIFTCIILALVLAGRKFFEGFWTTGVNDIVTISISFFLLLVLSFVIFMIGLGRLTTSTMNFGAKIPWSELIEAAWQGMTSKDGFNKHAKVIKDSTKTFWEKENWVDPEFKSRLMAALKSLIFPGWGLWSRGRKILAVGFWIATTIGYFAEIVPGILLHLLVIVLSGVLDTPVSEVMNKDISSVESN